MFDIIEYTTYDGNQLKKVTDQCSDLAYEGAMDFKDGVDKATEYAWDADGNMTKDSNKGITAIAYNVLNLPSRIVTGGRFFCHTVSRTA